MRASSDPSAADAARWSAVHHVVGPMVGGPAPLGLHGRGVELGDAVDTPTGRRRALVVPAGAEGDFGTYFSAFPGGQWHAHAGADRVRLHIRVGATAVLSVLRSDRHAAATIMQERMLEAGVDETVEVPLDGVTGLVWFRLRSGPAPVEVLAAAWEVAVPARPGTTLIGTPTVGRVSDVAANLSRIASAPALTSLLAGVLVIDHATEPIEPDLRRLADLPGLLRIVRQANIGGAGGYSRAMHEAVAAGADLALLMDDDVVIEPASLLRAIEFGRRTRGSEIVGLQMFDTARPHVLEAAAEVVGERTFWWRPADPALTGLDVTGVGAAHPALHRLPAADFAGWWAAIVPTDVIRAAGYALPMFLKWDDAEYALRARRLGFRTVSLQGAAIWHESWRIKDDARTWPAYFHARNRLIVALLHGPRAVRTGVLLSGLAIELKQLLALQTFAVERRQEGLRDVLAGPARLRGTSAEEAARLLGLAAGAPDQQRVPTEQADTVRPAAPRPLAPVRPPTGVALPVWVGLLLLRHLLAPVRADGVSRLPAGRGTWWVLPSFDEVFAPTADGQAYFHLRRDRGRFRRLLVSGVRLHLRLWFAWPTLRREYRAAAAGLASTEAWAARFRATDVPARR